MTLIWIIAFFVSINLYLSAENHNEEMMAMALIGVTITIVVILTLRYLEGE